MTLLETWLDITGAWVPVFAQARTAERAIRQALGALVCVGRRTITRIIWANGGAQRNWSSEYFLHSRAKWEPQKLFAPILSKGVGLCRGPLVGVGVDDTRLHKTGRCIQQAFYQRDPLSPPTHTNLMLGVRFLQASLLVPLHQGASASCRALPIRFEESSPVKRPRRNADETLWKEYRLQRKQHNLSTHFVQMMDELRHDLDEAGAAKKTLVLATDASFGNRTVFGAPRDRTEIIARTRKDAVLCERANDGSRRFYALDKFTPEQIRKDDHVPWRTTKLFYGGKRRKVRYKVVGPVYWQGGARRLPLRVLVVAPTPYRKRKSAKLYYRQPAYLLTTDLTHRPKALLQIYFDRWQIEVNHREEKDTLGVGQAQVWNPKSVPRQPVLVVAAYSALLLASLLAFGPFRGEAYAKLPKWRRKAKRPSCLDLITLLRHEMDGHPELLAPMGIDTSLKDLAASAAA
jgi:hypothetical protein